MTLWQARQASVNIANAIVDPNTTSDFLTAQAAVSTNEIDFTSTAKDCEFKEPEVSTSEVKLLGATGGNQNQEIDPQSPTKGEFTATLIMNPNGTAMNDLEEFKLTASGTTATGYTKRYNYASAAPTAGVSVVIQFTDGTDVINFLLNNAIVETLGGVKIDADGHAEQEIRVTASADDCWKEWDNN